MGPESRFVLVGELDELEPVEDVWIDEVSLDVEIEGTLERLDPDEWMELPWLGPVCLLIVVALTVERMFGRIIGAGACGRGACSGAE
jgi:hypothetical protein